MSVKTTEKPDWELFFNSGEDFSRQMSLLVFDPSVKNEQPDSFKQEVDEIDAILAQLTTQVIKFETISDILVGDEIYSDEAKRAWINEQLAAKKSIGASVLMLGFELSNPNQTTPQASLIFEDQSRRTTIGVERHELSDSNSMIQVLLSTTKDLGSQ